MRKYGRALLGCFGMCCWLGVLYLYPGLLLLPLGYMLLTLAVQEVR